MIFHSYVSLPEGTLRYPTIGQIQCVFHRKKIAGMSCQAALMTPPYPLKVSIGDHPRPSQTHWVGLRENLNRKPRFLPSNIGLSCKFSHHPIL